MINTIAAIDLAQVDLSSQSQSVSREGHHVNTEMCREAN